MKKYKNAKNQNSKKHTIQDKYILYCMYAQETQNTILTSDTLI